MAYDNFANTREKIFIVRDPIIDFEFSYMTSRPRQNYWRNRLLVSFILIVVSLGLLLSIIAYYNVDYARSMTDSPSYRLIGLQLPIPMLDEIPIMDEKVLFGKINNIVNHQVQRIMPQLAINHSPKQLWWLWNKLLVCTKKI